MNFDSTVVAAVTGHMNGDHPEDNLLIAKAFGYPESTEAAMTGLDAEAGMWRVADPSGEHELRVPWPGGAISERPEIRREVVKLYKEACARLGIAPRDEHPSKPFSRVIREGSWGDHSSSEGSSFMEDIMRGRGTKQDYIDLSAQHYFMYEALEEAAARLAADPDTADFHPAALARLGALEADLEFLLGQDWRERIEAVPATADYAARIREIGAEGWIPGIVAHHYTRYLGDLSGGQIIAKRVARHHGFERAGIEFYDFEALGSLSEFKERYRAGLDRLGARLSAAEQQRMLDEVRRAYAFNTAVFVDLSRQKTRAA